MRYEVGQKYPFIDVKFHARDGVMNPFMNLFHPQYHELDSIEVKMLEVTEHHKVPIEYSDATTDGFILKEVKGSEIDRIWYNQYPTAHYGQISTDNDWMVNRHLTDDEGKRVDQMSNQEIDYLVERWDYALSFVGSIFRALNGPANQRLTLTSEVRSAFVTYLDQVVEKIEDATEMKVIFEELTMKKIDGTFTEPVPLYWIARLVKVEDRKAA
ncbi:hypothetical protein EVB97_074 [Rhizobium phage RHph_Y65]|uniref:Uncharacterized protein n=1 Tax=Rhizobium phage RHph_Y65 TaxID=2509785 RepID=A0A7S5R7P6_9CAUD|nr:hypothetical protein PQC17_gp074 [Rhizobium phage RHph_Y65]QIG72632.1 hypothetical protein EVB97_074 [Rhizobium phage RHph_Y65]